MTYLNSLLKFGGGIILAAFFLWNLDHETLQAAAKMADPFTLRELVFTNGEVQLSGTLYLPAGEGPFPAAVLMHGAGPDTREPYIPDAEMLVDGGIAAFVFDKRGTGASTGNWRRASLDELMADGLAAIALLQRQPEIDAAKIGVLGSSQGAWLAPFMAARSEQVAYFIQVTGSATTLAKQEMWDDGNSLKALGFSDLAIETEMKALQLLYSSRDLIRRGILPLDHLWFVYYDPNLNPADAWPRVQVPALVLFGGQDRTVPTEDSVRIVQESLTQSGHAASRIVIFPDRGHALGGSARNQDAAYTALVTGWIQAVTNGEAMPEMPFPDTYTSSNHLHWHGVGANSTPWYATASVQLLLILVFLLNFLTAVFASLLPWVKVGGALPRLALGLLGVTNLFLLGALLYVLNYLLNADAESASPNIPMQSWLFPLGWVSILLVGMLIYFRRRNQAENRQRQRSALVTTLTLVAIAFIPFLGYWGVFNGQY